VGVARAMVTGPRLVCMDEPAAGLDSRESVALGERLRTIADTGTSVSGPLGAQFLVWEFATAVAGRVLG